MTVVRETLEQAGYASAKQLDETEVLLTLPCGASEIWFINDGHASYGIAWNGHDLEFAREANG